MYYKGNNIGLNYDAANGTWSFSNEPQDYIDTNAFSTPDPVFDYTPPSADDDEQEEDTNCPEGYIYDNTLKQCIPDPAVQNRYMQQNQGGGNNQPAVQIAGTNRTTTDGNFIATDAEYKSMSAGELIENYKQRGFIDKDERGNLVIDLNKVSRKGSIMDALLGRFTDSNEADASFKKVYDNLKEKGIIDAAMDSNLNPNLLNFYVRPGQTLTSDNLPLSKVASVGKIVLPSIGIQEAEIQGSTPNVVVQGYGGTVFGKQKFDDYMANKLKAFSTVANNTISNYNADTAFTGSYSDNILQDRLNKEKERKAKFDADIAQIKANKEKIKAERDMQKLIKEAEEREKLKNELDDMIPKGDDKDKDKNNIIKGPNPGDAGGTSTYSSGSSSPSTGQSVGPVGAPVSVTIPRGPDLTNR
jgi:hypothetical protein